MTWGAAVETKTMEKGVVEGKAAEDEKTAEKEQDAENEYKGKKEQRKNIYNFKFY